MGQKPLITVDLLLYYFKKWCKIDEKKTGFLSMEPIIKKFYLIFSPKWSLIFTRVPKP